MSTAEIIAEYVHAYPGTLVTPTIVKAWAAAKFGAVSLSEPAIAARMKSTLTPHSRGVFVARPRPLPRVQGALL